MGSAQAPLSIWLITVGEPLPLPGNTARLWRTGLLARLLARQGHRVTWWTSSVDHFNKRFFVEESKRLEIEPNLLLQFLHGRLYKRNVSLARWMNHREIAQEFGRIAPSEPRPAIILCSYPTIELSVAATQYGRSRGIPVLLDIRDLWPDEMVALAPNLLRPFARIALWPMFRQARTALRLASGLVAISERYLEWALSQIPRSRTVADAVFPHGYPAHSCMPVENAAAEWCKQIGIDRSKRIFWFVGTFVGSIDLGTVIEAARQLATREDVLFVLSGSGQQDAAWRAQASGLPNVVFTGWLDAEQLSALASIAWVGLGAYKKGALMSLTNKLFEYMAYGLPILLSLDGEARRVVENARCGAFYEPGSAKSLAMAVRDLCDNPRRRDDMALQALAAFKRHYSADSVYGRFSQHLEMVARAASPVPATLKPLVGTK